MKSEGGGQVIAFPGPKDTATHIHGRKGSDCSGVQERRLVGEAFLLALRSNIESAEEIAFGGQVGLKRTESEEETLCREDLLEPGHFGVLFAAIEGKAVLGMRAHVHHKTDSAAAATDLAARPESVPGRVPERRGGVSRPETKVALVQGGLQAMLDKQVDLPFEAQLDAKNVRSVGQPPDDTAPRPALEMLLLPVVREELSPRHSVQISAKAPADVTAMSGPTIGGGQHEPGQDFKSRNKSDQKISDLPEDAAGSDAVETPAAIAEAGLTPAMPEAASAVRQIAENIRQAVPTTTTGPAQAWTDQGRAIRFKLQPENLGEVEIKIRMRGDHVHISIQLEKHEVATMISASQDDLRSVLSAHGLQVEAVDVGLGRAGRETSNQGQTESQSQNSQQFQRQEQGAAGGSNGFRNRASQPEWLQPAHQDGKKDAKPAPEGDVRAPVRRGLYL